MNNKITRRGLIARGFQVPLGSVLLLGLSSCGSDGGKENRTVCADPETMSASQASMRASLAYTADSPDPEKQCMNCTYFNAGAGDCGSCDLLGGAAVNSMGRCDSWSQGGA